MRPLLDVLGQATFSEAMEGFWTCRDPDLVGRPQPLHGSSCIGVLEALVLAMGMWVVVKLWSLFGSLL